MTLVPTVGHDVSALGGGAFGYQLGPLVSQSGSTDIAAISLLALAIVLIVAIGASFAWLSVGGGFSAYHFGGLAGW